MSTKEKETQLKYIVVIICAVTAVVSASPFPAAAVPVTGPMPYRAINASRTRDEARQPAVNLPPGPIEAVLERLSPAERANAEIALDLGPHASLPAQNEARNIERLWNSGDFAAAIEHLRALPNYADPAQVFININWRTPIPTRAGTDWGTNVQIGNRDSAAYVIFDRHNGTGNLFVGIVSNAGPSTYLYMNMSTDNGRTWVETASGFWTAAHAVLGIAGVCNGNHFCAAYSSRVLPNYIRSARYLATTGLRVPFRNDSTVVTVLTTAPEDTIREVAMTAADDVWPGWRIYAFGSTKLRNLVFAFSDSFAQPWYLFATNVTGWCDGALSCTYNPGWTSRGFFAAWRYIENDSVNHVGLAWFDTSNAFHATYFNPSSPRIWVTSVAAYADTVLIAYEHANLSTIFYTRELYTRDNGHSWYWHWIPDDTLGQRENPDVTGRHGEGFAAVYRERLGASGRYLCYTHAPYHLSPGSWSIPDTVSDWRPDVNELPRVQWLGLGLYGVAYIKWGDEPGYTVWFNRSDFTGITERRDVILSAAKNLMRVLPGKGRVGFSFNNPVSGDVRLRVVDAAGRIVHSGRTFLGAGPNTLEFAGSVSGIYFAALDIGNLTATAKFLLVR
jgi:catechol 2,3-dioxygenase-like lactoylglutathione lyase family enzyme